MCSSPLRFGEDAGNPLRSFRVDTLNTRSRIVFYDRDWLSRSLYVFQERVGCLSLPSPLLEREAISAMLADGMKHGTHTPRHIKAEKKLVFRTLKDTLPYRFQARARTCRVHLSRLVAIKIHVIQMADLKFAYRVALLNFDCK